MTLFPPSPISMTWFRAFDPKRGEPELELELLPADPRTSSAGVDPCGSHPVCILASSLPRFLTAQQSRLGLTSPVR
ncbi:hypothetical protein E4U54_006384, partial [Claviceps lovelessii]